MTNPPSEQRVLDILRTITDQKSGQDLVTSGLLTGLVVRDGHVMLALEAQDSQSESTEALRQRAEKAVSEIAGVIKVTAVLTASLPPAGEKDQSCNTPGCGPSGCSSPGQPHTAKQQHPHGYDPRPTTPLLPQVKTIIAVASGKGGVGKSTTSINLALALHQMGLKVGIFDADIYGPSLPRMIDLHDGPESPDGKILLPLEKYGLKCMSIGFLVDEDTPVIWRGPMVMGALQQLMRDVQWGELDVMVVDMPPGTGDTQLTMTQSVPLTGAVIVSTPQDIALADARKGLAMFRKVNVPILGIVENMSHYHCPHCGHEDHIFGHGGAKAEAERLSCAFLGEIPLESSIRAMGDAGTPVMVSQPDGPHAAAYRAIAAKIRDSIAPQLA